MSLLATIACSLKESSTVQTLATVDLSVAEDPADQSESFYQQRTLGATALQRIVFQRVHVVKRSLLVNEWSTGEGLGVPYLT